VPKKANFHCPRHDGMPNEVKNVCSSVIRCMQE